jgi:hypothetical protein
MEVGSNLQYLIDVLVRDLRMSAPVTCQCLRRSHDFTNLPSIELQLRQFVEFVQHLLCLSFLAIQSSNLLFPDTLAVMLLKFLVFDCNVHARLERLIEYFATISR